MRHFHADELRLIISGLIRRRFPFENPAWVNPLAQRPTPEPTEVAQPKPQTPKPLTRSEVVNVSNIQCVCGGANPMCVKSGGTGQVEEEIIESQAQVPYCYKCRRSFENQELLELHKKDHEIKKVVQRSDLSVLCPCCRETVKLSVLKAHASQFHSIKGHQEIYRLIFADLVTCEYCSVSFHKDDLQDHIGFRHRAEINEAKKRQLRGESTR